jgi:hypothetical protein
MNTRIHYQSRIPRVWPGSRRIRKLRGGRRGLLPHMQGVAGSSPAASTKTSPAPHLPYEMTPETELEQKAFRTKIHYRFFGDHVEYAISDRNFNKTSFSTRYADLPSKFDYRVFQPWWPVLSLAALMVMLLGLMWMMLPPDESADELGFPAIFGAFGIGVAALLQWHLKNIYTLIPTRNGNLLV